MKESQTVDARKWWQTAASPVKLRYLEHYAIGHTALDLGSGAGHYARALRERGFQVTGLDVAVGDYGDCFYVQARLNALPFARAFDTVLAFDILEHEADEANAWHELRRVTGQRLILSVPNAEDHLLTRYNLTYKHHIDKTHQREYHMDELGYKVEQAGFRILHLGKEGPVSPAVLAEFMPTRPLRTLMRLLLKGLHFRPILYNAQLMADLYAVAEPAK
jgi:SAM-dependent methyltransferase